MNNSNKRSTPAVVIGVGSNHGDDQVGWQAAEMLRRHPRFAEKAVAVEETTRLIDHLGGCEYLVIVDACASGARPGTITRLCWPDRSVAEQHGSSTHGVGVADALRLAQELGVLPARVVVYGVEGENYEPASDMSPAVRRALPELVERVVEELEQGAGTGG